MKKSTLLKTSAAKLFFALAFLLCFANVNKAQTVTYTVTQQPCNAGGIPDGSVSITVSGLNFPIHLQWYGGNGITQYDTLTSSYTITYNNWAGGYSYIQADDGTNWAYNNFSSPPFTYGTSTNSAICPALGSATATMTGGTAPFTVNWLDLSMTNVIATGNPVALPGGQYAVNITDAAGCVFGSKFNMDSIWVGNVSGINGTVTTTTASCTNGTASVSASGGMTPYTYLWSNGATSSSISGLVAGSYDVTVTDAQGCNEVFYAYVQQSININTNYTQTPATCLQYNGSAMAFASNGTAPYSYLWSNGQTTQTLSNVQGGSYNFTVSDANGCQGWGGAYIVTSTPITATYSSNASQCTSSTGSASVTISGGTAPYTVNWNTYPAQNGTSATNLSQGSYGFTITDAVGCLRSGAAYIPPVSTISGYVTTTNTPCTMSTGTAQVTAGGSAPPFSYLWNNNSTATSISALPAGGYSCQVTDANGCSKSFWGSVNVVSPVSIGFSTTQASCIFTNDGSVTATATGGAAPYTYSWGASTINNLVTGGYYCTATDANGCTASGYTYVGYNSSNTSCYCEIQGYAYEDLNGNCTQDPGENGINHVMIGCTGAGSTFTNANGFYSFVVPTGSYTISENPQGLVNLAPCQNNNQFVNVTANTNCVIPINFGNTITQVHDIKVLTFGWNQPVVGQTYSQSTVISNEGTYSENNIQFGFAHDGQLGFQSSSPLTYTQQNAATFPNWYSVTSGFPTLAAGQYLVNYNSYNVPTNIPLGTSLVINDTVSYMAPISNWLNENSPWNNVEYYQPTVVGSFDPNFKEVTPKGTGAQGIIPFTDTLLNYTIHFQNTGTAPAQIVVVTDTLDSDLDFTTLRPGWSNHDYVATLSNSGILKFTFNNINLADSMSSPMGSIGIVTYSIEAKNGLANLTQIKNSANIYFDFNTPIITNKTVNTYDNSVGIKNIAAAENDLLVYPNPAGENVMLSFGNIKDENTFVEVYDISGKQVISQKFSTSTGKNFINLDLRSLSNGLYILKVKNSSGEKVKKVSVAK